MRTVAKTPTLIRPADNGEWLYTLLGAVRREVAHQPNAGTVARIRARVLEGLDTPQRAAA